MKIVNISGGLGNQMFQYAFAVALKYQHPEEDVFIDIQHCHTIFFRKFKGTNLHDGFEIKNIFANAKLPIADFSKIVKISYWIPNYTLSRIGRKLLPIRKTEYVPPYNMNYYYNKKALEQEGDCYYEGYWQSSRFYSNIKKQLMTVFSAPTPNQYNAGLIREIEICNSVGVHVRRGDYLYEPEFRGICGIEYYRKAIADLVKDGREYTFFIFSNDMQWCSEFLFPLLNGHKIVAVRGNTGRNSCWDMFLMTHCKDLIIANSSFSWWGAFLNNVVKRVYAPEPWLNRDCEISIYEDSWYKVRCKISE